MFEKYLQNYRNFPKEIWILALMTFINRAGTMVIPFLSKYLNESLHFTYSQIGWVLVFFGIGSIIGTWISGKLSDIFGFYKVMVFSLFATGLCFFALQFITSFIGFCIAILVLTSIADMYRPAMLVSLNSFTKKTNRTRALTLIRSAINLGFLFGPAIAGLIIMNNGYSQLFFIDGATCILAVTIFAIFIKERKLPFELKKHNIGKDYYSVIKDKPFLIHLIVTTITGILFFQILTILPIYYKYQYNLTDINCGLLLSVKFHNVIDES
jgi:predicted MFS family arabinose efflux permease